MANEIGTAIATATVVAMAPVAMAPVAIIPGAIIPGATPGVSRTASRGASGRGAKVRDGKPMGRAVIRDGTARYERARDAIAPGAMKRGVARLRRARAARDMKDRVRTLREQNRRAAISRRARKTGHAAASCLGMPAASSARASVRVAADVAAGGVDAIAARTRPTVKETAMKRVLKAVPAAPKPGGLISSRPVAQGHGPRGAHEWT